MTLRDESETVESRQQQREAHDSGVECDALLISSDGVPFNAHKKYLCEASELFEAFFAKRWEDTTGTDGKYESKNLDSECLQIILDEIYGKKPQVPAQLLLPVLMATEFLMLKSNRLREYCKHVIAREPFAVLEHNSFYRMIVENSELVDLILKTDLLLTNEALLRRICFSWPSDSSGLVDTAKKRLKTQCQRSRDVAYFYDRSSTKFFGFTGNRSFHWFESENLTFPRDVQHMAVSGNMIMYASSDEVRTCGSRRATYNEEADFKWPPLLKSYGRTIVWTERNRRRIRFTSRELYPKEKSEFVDLDKHATIVRHFATPDYSFHKRIVFVATQDGAWKVFILRYDDPVEMLEDLTCPLKRIDGVAVFGNRIYVLGNETMSDVSNKLLVYRENDKRWTFLRDRVCEDDVKAFFPLNGRLYVACNGRDTCEVYEPGIDTWMRTDFYRMDDIACFAVASRADF